MSKDNNDNTTSNEPAFSEPTVDITLPNERIEEEGDDETGLISGVPKRKKDYNTIKLSIMIAMVAVFFLAELVFGLITSSLTLLSDSFHMLSDLMSLFIGLIAILLGKRSKTTNLSYGWGRAEILGGLVNGVFLLSVDFFIVLEAVQRFFEPKPITRPIFVLIVGGLGLLVNIIGLFIFGHDHGHGHGHDHDHDHDHENENEHTHGTSHNQQEENNTDVESQQKDKKHKSGCLQHMNVNIMGVFLHVFGDFLGSIAVMISATIIYLLGEDHKWPQYVDPALSLVIALLILCTTIPLVTNTAKILLQGVPSSVDLSDLEQQLYQINGVKGVHELHVWQLVNNRHVGSVHILCDGAEHFMNLAEKAQQVFHEHGVHSTTIQPEFETRDRSLRVCKLRCSSACADAMCCPPKIEKSKSNHVEKNEEISN
eukprot:gb/GECH01005026.1/.p1 GENE.gb/GECH01005026.1/~~gb/GECH01005026.1/.p1  ORF type:complete len:426 (+),score=70.40 gb/GECH01005026.1/:1-1278(+)